MQAQALKREALGQKQTLERLVALYDAFQNYAESLTPFVKGGPATPQFQLAMERFRLMFQEYQTAFYEWHEGAQTLNAGVAAFLNHTDEFLNNEQSFTLMLTLATAKFQDLMEKAGRNLRELHEQIALEEGQSKAEEITHVPSSALTKLKDADAVGEIATKWLGRAVKFAPWAYELLRRLAAR